MMGIRNVGSVSAETAADWLEQDRALLVQVRGVGEGPRAVPGAVRMSLEDPIPEAVLEADRPLLVVASEPDEALRVAARLVRAGVRRVSVVSGTLGPAREIRTAEKRPSLAQPLRTSDHPIQ